MAAFCFTCDAYGSLNSPGEMGNGVRALLSTHQMTGFCPRKQTCRTISFSGRGTICRRHWLRQRSVEALITARIIPAWIEAESHFAIPFHAGAAKAPQQ